MQYADPAVSRRKFDTEVAEFRAQEASYRAKGWLLLKASFPDLLFAMVATHIPLAPVVLGVSFDYTNYDAEPPSLQLVNPFNDVAYTMAKVPTLLPRFRPAGQVGPPVENLLQGTPDAVPFLCIPGVREYHEHPAHTGDPWELHRGVGSGRFVRLLQIIADLGVNTQQITVQMQVTLTGRLHEQIPTP